MNPDKTYWSEGNFDTGRIRSKFPKPWFQENDASPHHIHKKIESLCNHCYYDWQLGTFLVPSLLWLATQDFSCAVVAMAGDSGLFLCPHHYYGWRPETFLVPSLLWLATQDFSCAVIAMAGVLGLFLYHRHPCSTRAASWAFGQGGMSSLDSFGVILCHHTIRRKRANVICNDTISSRGINWRRMWWGKEALYVG
eukprot:scaffold36167_cov51-Attheya_sp.AAC.4